MDATSALIKARALLDAPTPLKRDCGRLCGARCCEPDADGRGGMLLFPGEEALYRGNAAFEITDCADIPFGRLITCLENCAREDRPLSCRLFPLWPGADGRIGMDRRALGTCPLCAGGMNALAPGFISAAAEAAGILYAVPEHRRFLEAVEKSVSDSLKATGLWEV